MNVAAIGYSQRTKWENSKFVVAAALCTMEPQTANRTNTIGLGDMVGETPSNEGRPTAVRQEMKQVFDELSSRRDYGQPKSAFRPSRPLDMGAPVVDWRRSPLQS